jgi:excisionase family DNA binding protein
MTEPKCTKAVGGVAPFGYRWLNGSLVIEEAEAPVRKLIYELFLQHRRKKTVARLLNDLGYRTRSKSGFSDTTIDRLIRDTTAKGVRVVNGEETCVDPIVSIDLWERANNILGRAKPKKQTVNMFAGLAFCECGGTMIVPSNLEKYVCVECRRKVATDDLEQIFESQLAKVEISLDDSDRSNLADYWRLLTVKEKQIVTEQICERITVCMREVKIEFGYSPHSFKTAVVEQQKEAGNETHTQADLESSSPVSEPLLSEAEAARFLGISKMTLLRKRNAGEIGYFRVGFRVLYSREKHLVPFLERCEKCG